MTRTDLHRPSAIVPADYEFIACDYFGPFGGQMMLSDRKYYRMHCEKTGGKQAERHNTGTCHICGASAMYVARYYHAKTNAYIMTGMDCAEKMDFGGQDVFKSFRKNIAKQREFARGQQKARNTLCALGMSVALELYDATDKQSQTKGERIIVDMVGKLVRYGSLSGAQVAFLDRLICDRDVDGSKTAAKAAEQAAKVAKMAHIGKVGDRVEMTLTINYVSSRNGHFGVTYFHSMTDAAGNPVMYSGSKELGAKGETVRVKATVKEHGSYKDAPQTVIARPQAA